MKPLSLMMLGAQTRPPIVRRPPLPAFPQPVNYDDTLPAHPPSTPDLLFYRGQFCGLRVPGAPVVAGGNPSNPDLMMACLLDNYPSTWQDRFLEVYASYGYTHLQRSVGHALGYGSSLASYIALTKRTQSIGLFADHWLIANEFPGFEPNQDASFWGPKLDPIIGALLDADAIDCCCPSWQMDQVMQSAPGNATIGIIAHVSNMLPPETPIGTHWMNEAGAWWKTGGEVWTDEYQTVNVHDRFSWWVAMQPYLTWFHHQGDTRIDIKLYQDKLRDTLEPFADGRMGNSWRLGGPFGLIVYECSAQDQFDGKMSEDDGDLRSYLICCVNSGNYVSGYGNGCRRPDGWSV